jgi:hypothetical protein
MNVNLYITTAYENKHNWTLGENEPKTNPIPDLAANNEYRKQAGNPSTLRLHSGQALLPTSPRLRGAGRTSFELRSEIAVSACALLAMAGTRLPRPTGRARKDSYHPSGACTRRCPQEPARRPR